MPQSTPAVSVLKETWSEFSKHDSGTMAAALAYYTVFALPAALLIVVKIAGSVLGERAVQGQLQAQIAATMGPQVGDEIGIMVQKAAASSAVTGFTGSLGLPGGLVHLGDIVVTFFIFAFLFGAVYKVLPDAQIDWKDVRIGSVVTALLFVIGKFLIGLYLGHTSPASGYGVAGSLALLLLWTYYSSMIFLLGAEFTQVWARRHGKTIEPDSHAVRVIEEERPRRAA